MTEKPLQDRYIELLQTLRVPYIHIPNRAFKGKYTPLKCLKDFPDLDFQFNGKRYMREFGIKGRNKDRKILQFEKMLEYEKRGADIKIIETENELKADWLLIGLIK